MYAWVNSKSGGSRPDEIYAALSEGGFLAYTAALKEQGGFFLKFDTTTVTLTPGQQMYTLPADLTNLVHISERLTSADDWAPMEPVALGTTLDNVQSSVGWDAFDFNWDDTSDYSFYGPYLSAAAVAAGVQTQQITVSPNPDALRMVQLAYTAMWLPIVSDASLVMLPEEGTYAMQNYALAEILRANDDTLAKEYEGKGDKHLSAFLTWVRQRQTQQRPRIAAYLED